MRFIPACSCFVIVKYCFEEYDSYGVIDWAVQTYDKWINDGRPKCVDVKQLDYYVVVSSIRTG